jgi:predicted ArsR family transcriptional regulator
VFHSLARRNADVCRFDIAFMEAATGRRIQRAECIVRGGYVCRCLLSHNTVSDDTKWHESDR